MIKPKIIDKVVEEVRGELTQKEVEFIEDALERLTAYSLEELIDSECLDEWAEDHGYVNIEDLPALGYVRSSRF